MKPFKTKSLREHLWLYFCGFTVGIMAILWVLQVLFLNTFFKQMKLSELSRVGKEILSQYDISGDDDFYKYWSGHAFNSGIFAHVVSEDGTDENSERDSEKNLPPDNSDFQGRKPHFDSRVFFDRENFDTFIEKFSDGNTNQITYIATNSVNHGQFAVYGAYLGKKDGKKMYLYLSSPLERTDTTRKVLQTQLIIVIALSVIIALVLSYFISRRLSEPIEDITKKAHKLAKGDYDDVHFEGGAYREVDELAETLNYATLELSKTEKLRRDLISNVSHDLRTPLTIIQSYAEMIRDVSGENKAKRDKHTNVIIDETKRLSELVSDMLDLSRIQSGTVKMQMHPFDIAALVRETLERFEYYREHFGYVFKTDIPDSCTAVGDSSRIGQAVYNLIGNAVNYTGDDKTVFVSLKENDGSVRFSVRDTGKGIPADELELVWEKYYKASGTYHRQTVGTGIGLSIVKNILVSHNARYGVNSADGGGTEFWFEI